MKAPERFETERLVLRRPLDADAGEIFRRYAGDPEVTRYLAWPTHRSLDDTHAFILLSSEQWGSWPAGPVLIESRSTGTLLGSTGLRFHAGDTVETGYLLARDSWGKGYATEALRSMLDLSCALGARTVHAHCHAGHTASVRVLESCGFTRRGVAKRQMRFPNLGSPEPADLALYAIDFGAGTRPRVHIMNSGRLGFSFWTDSDLPLALALWGDTRVSSLIDARGRLGEDEVRERLAWEIRLHDAEQIQYWPVFLLDTGAFAGCCGLRPYRPAERIYELGVHLKPEVWGKGLATEACLAVIGHAFGRLGARGLFAGHHPENAPSRRLLLRLGFRYTHDERYPPTGLNHPSYFLAA